MHYIVVSLLLVLLSVSLGIAKDCTDPCTTVDGETGFCFEKKCLSQVDEEEKQNLTFTITVIYPEAELKKQGNTRLHIRGNGLGLLWIKGTQLTLIRNDTWQINITYKWSPDGFQCQTCTDHAFLPDNKLQYRIFADDRDDMLGANFAVKFPISQTSSYFNSFPNFITYPWFNKKTGSLREFTIQSKHIGGDRNVTIYTPPSFSENTYKTYPLILVFDLSFQIASFLKRNFEGPILPNAVSEEYVLLGFGDYKNNGEERNNLLTPTRGPFLVCKNGTFGDNCGDCIPFDVSENGTEYMDYLRKVCGKTVLVGGLGDSTLDFLLTEALPFANQTVSSRLQADNIGVMGYSLGGLMSCYAAWTRPHVFSFAACQSPSFWWPYNELNMDAVDFDFMNKTLKDPKFQVNRSNQKIYLDAGGTETLDPFRLTQAVVETGQKLKQFGNYRLNENVWVMVDQFKTHHFVEWGKRVRRAMATLLPAGGAQRMPPVQDTLIG